MNMEIAKPDGGGLSASAELLGLLTSLLHRNRDRKQEQGGMREKACAAECRVAY